MNIPPNGQALIFIGNPFSSSFGFFAGLLLIAFVVPGACFLPAQELSDSPEILIDKVHANEYSDIGLIPGEYDYHKAFGFRFAFEYLRHRGIRTAEHTQGRLDEETLRKHRLLFLNLVSAERPPFYVSEIDAIVEFVRRGGSLFVIVEHSNAYFHAWRLAPLMDKFGIEIPTDTACDVAPNTLGGGNGWILVKQFADHPVTRGLRRIAFQTGGCVDDRYAIAWTSMDSWADAWQTGTYGEKHGMGFFGNWKKDEGERGGPLGVVLAKEFGRGRIVIVGDQNMFSDVYIDYADNYRLWINAVAWLLPDNKIPGLADPAEYRKFRQPKILFAEDFNAGIFGMDDKFGCYHLMTFVRRHYSGMADDRYEEPYELVILPTGHLKTDDTMVDLVVGHLRRGKSVLALHTSPSAVGEAGTILTQVFRKTGPLQVRFEKIADDLVAARTDVGGSVYILPPETLLYNSMLSEPSSVPTDWDIRKTDAFLRHLESILAPASK